MNAASLVRVRPSVRLSHVWVDQSTRSHAVARIADRTASKQTI